MCRRSAKNWHQSVYPNMDSAQRTVEHHEALPIPIPPDDELGSIKEHGS